MPAISVIVVNWNSGPWLSRTFKGLSLQTMGDFEVILVDNASQDNSVSQALPILPNVRLLQQENNLGFAAANNLAAQIASGRWLAFLNPDAIPNPDWLERLLAATIDNPAFTFFGSHQIMAEQPELLDGIGDTYHVSGLAWRTGHGSAARFATQHEPVEIFSPCAAAALYRRDIFLAAGGLDERYFCYFEDVDLGFRLRLLGHRAMYIPNAIVHHAGSAITGAHSDFTVYHSQRNLVWTFIKNMPSRLLLIYFPLHLGLNLFSIIYFVNKGQGRVVLKAKWDAIRGIPETLRERRKIQSGRRAKISHLLAQFARGWPNRSRSR